MDALCLGITQVKCYAFGSWINYLFPFESEIVSSKTIQMIQIHYKPEASTGIYVSWQLYTQSQCHTHHSITYDQMNRS